MFKLFNDSMIDISKAIVIEKNDLSDGTPSICFRFSCNYTKYVKYTDSKIRDHDFNHIFDSLHVGRENGL